MDCTFGAEWMSHPRPGNGAVGLGGEAQGRDDSLTPVVGAAPGAPRQPVRAPLRMDAETQRHEDRLAAFWEQQLAAIGRIDPGAEASGGRGRVRRRDTHPSRRPPARRRRRHRSAAAPATDDPNTFKAPALPLARIKKIIKSDDDVRVRLGGDIAPVRHR